jgi:dihydrofolate synthase/folylpolyglutamate synthase
VTSLVVCTTLGAERRGRPAEELAALARNLGLCAEVADTPLAGWQRCLAVAQATDWILITGSLYLVGDLRDAVRRLAV